MVSRDRPIIVRTADDVQTRIIGLLLIDDFALMSYASIIEPFRAANDLSGVELYRWIHISVDGKAARASNGASILADQSVSESISCDILFVFAGGEPRSFDDHRTFSWLRRAARAGSAIAGVSGGPYVLAKAGLLENYRATIHWEHAATLRDDFPQLELTAVLYVIDRRRMTCAGGIAGLDLALELIERDHGRDLANRVSEWFIRTETRGPERSQRLSLRERYGVRHEALLRALEEMEVAIETPKGRDQLASAAGVSVRQLERLFHAHLCVTIGQAYLRIRLENAERMLRTTSLSVKTVAFACGFASSSHFARVFRKAYGRPPAHRAGGDIPQG